MYKRERGGGERERNVKISIPHFHRAHSCISVYNLLVIFACKNISNIQGDFNNGFIVVVLQWPSPFLYFVTVVKEMSCYKLNT